jgi:hypothetical protein
MDPIVVGWAVVKGGGSALGGWLGRTALSAVQLRWNASGLRGKWRSRWLDDRGVLRQERITIDGITLAAVFGRVDQLDERGRVLPNLGCKIEGKVEDELVSLHWYRDREARRKIGVDFGGYVLQKRATTSGRTTVLAGRAIGVDHVGNPIDAQHLVVPEGAQLKVEELEEIRFSIGVDRNVLMEILRRSTRRDAT